MVLGELVDEEEIVFPLGGLEEHALEGLETDMVADFLINFLDFAHVAGGEEQDQSEVGTDDARHAGLEGLEGLHTNNEKMNLDKSAKYLVKGDMFFLDGKWWKVVDIGTDWKDEEDHWRRPLSLTTSSGEENKIHPMLWEVFVMYSPGRWIPQHHPSDDA